MANWCDNSLELITTSRPDWIDAQEEGDCAMPFPSGDMYAFDKSIVSLVQGDKNEWILKLCFNTKWAPPEDFYRWLVAQPGVLFFYANYCEPGCQILGEFCFENGEFIDNFVGIPNSFNSSALDKEVFITEPHNLYYEFYDEDSRMTFEEYLKAIYDLGNQDTSLRDALTVECVEGAKLLKINLEDQKWVEFIASIEGQVEATLPGINRLHRQII